MSVYKKLQEARILLQNTSLKKSGRNKFANYEYFELGDFLPTIQNIFSKVGLCGTVSFGTEIATLTIVDVDATDTTTPNYVVFSSPMSSAELKGCHAIQNLGAVQTYLRRYLWVAAMEIVEHDALDATTGSDSKKVEPTKSSPRIVGVATPWRQGEDPKAWIIDAPGKPEGDVRGWLDLIENASHLQLGFATKVEDLETIFRKNKILFDTVKFTDTNFYQEMMSQFTEVKHKLEKENTNGTSI